MEQAKPLVNPTPLPAPLNPPIQPLSPKKPRLIFLLAFLFIVLVSLGAYFIFKFQTKPKALISSPIPSIQNSPTPSVVDETSNWKTYINSINNFSIKYPSNWFVKEESSGLFITENKIEVPLTHGLALMIGMQINIKKEPFEIPKYPWKHSLTPIKIGDLIATKWIDEEPDYSTELMYSRILFDKNGYTYTIVFTNTDSHGKYNPIYDQILSTFKFLE